MFLSISPRKFLHTKWFEKHGSKLYQLSNAILTLLLNSHSPRSNLPPDQMDCISSKLLISAFSSTPHHAETQTFLISFLKNLKNLFNSRLITILQWFCHSVPHSEPTSHLPSCPILQGPSLFLSDEVYTILDSRDCPHVSVDHL